MKLSKFVLPAILVIALGACQQGQVNKSTGGTLIGAGLGGLLGAQFGSGAGQLAAVAIGALGGAFIGSEIGKSLDNADKAALERTSQGALEANRIGQTSTWQNPDSGHSGSVTPTRTYQTASGENCREYQQTVTIAGKTETVFGTACRQSDGTWKITN